MKMIVQRPSEGYDWLFEDRADDDRYFTTVVYRPEGTDPWLECTDADKQAWEDEHRPEPTPDHEPEIQEAEIIDE